MNQQHRNHELSNEEHCCGARDDVNVALAHTHVIRALSLRDFCSRLITHFGIAYNRNEIIRPQRTGIGQPGCTIQ